MVIWSWKKATDRCDRWAGFSRTPSE